jgi:Skp family chaperone for outer membrane proteins
MAVGVCALGIAILHLMAASVAGQSPSPEARRWVPGRTPDGQPDIQGIWTNYDRTPFEVADDLVDPMRLAALARWFPGINNPRRRPDPNAPRGEVYGFADGPTASPRSRPRRSMVVDPPTGRVPLRPEAEARRDYHLAHHTDSWEHSTPWERCITRGVPGSIFPTVYGSAYQILQSPGYVVILYEMIHEARIIPVDGRPHLPSGIRQWNGDPRGRWEGETLVVETTNFNSKGSIATNEDALGLRGIPQSEALRVIERFRLVDANTMQYRVTIEDPSVYTSPWTVEMPLNRDPQHQIFEYACHEGNYTLPYILNEARNEEKAVRDGTSGTHRWAFVSIQRILTESAKGLVAIARVQALNQQRISELDGKKKALQAAEQKLAQSTASGPRLQIGSEIERMKADIARFTQDAQSEVKGLTQELQMEIQREVSPIIQQIATDMKIEMLFSQTNAGLLWSDARLDITRDVILRFDQMASAPTRP